MKIPRLTFTMHFLFCDHLLRRNEAILGTYPFLGLLLPRERQGCTLHFQTMILKKFIDAKKRCGPRWGTVCYGGRVTKLVFNGRVSRLMCTWVVKRLTGNFGSKLRFSVGLTSVKRRFSVNIPIETHIFTITFISQDDHLTAGVWVACRWMYICLDQMLVIHIISNNVNEV